MKEIKRLLVLQHLEIEGPGLFEQFAKERDLKIEIIRLDNKNSLPQTKKGDLILIFKSLSSDSCLNRPGPSISKCCKTNSFFIPFIHFPLFQQSQNRY